MSSEIQLRAMHAAELSAVTEIAHRAEARGGELTPEEKAECDARLKNARNIATQVEQLKSGSRVGDAEMLASIEALGDGGLGGYGITGKFAEHVVRHTKAAFGGRIPDSMSAGQIASAIPPMNVGGMKALITGDSATSGGALVTPQDLGLRDIGTFQRPLALRDLLTSGQTTSDAVEFVRVTGYTNAASPVPEATAASGSSGLKPESDLTFERVSESVRTIAHHTPVTTRALSDATQVRTILESFLRYGLEETLENQIINGTGTSEDFTGLVKLADDDEIQDQAFATNLLTTTRKAKTKVQTIGRATPNGYLFHPNDWEDFDLLTNDTQGNFYFGGPRNPMNPMLWGLPVILSEAVTEGFGWVADWRQGVLWDRQAATLTVGTINDQLIRNLVTFLLELRAAFGVLRPAAFVRIDLTS